MIKTQICRLCSAVLAVASFANPSSAQTLQTGFDDITIDGDERWPGWTLSPWAPEGTTIAVTDGRLVAEDASATDAAVLTFTADDATTANRVDISFQLQIDVPARSADAGDDSHFAFVRFGPSYDEGLGFLRFILTPDSADGGSMFVDITIGDDVKLDGGAVATGATKAFKVLSLHTPSKGMAELAVDDLSIAPAPAPAPAAEAKAATFPTRDEPLPELLALKNDIDLRGGRLVETRDFDLQEDDAAWQFQPHLYYWPIKDESGLTAWRSAVEKEWIGRHLYSLKTFPIESNRKYVVTALVKSDFVRADVEIDLGVEMLDEDHEILPAMRAAGLPADTAGDPANIDGWVRWEWQFVTANYDHPVKGRFIFRHNIGYTDVDDIDVRLAQVKLIELPVEEHAVEGDGTDLVTFRGGPGNLPMAVESVDEQDGVITVVTTGTKFTFDTKADRVRARQRIDFKRDLFDADFSLPLANLQVVRHDDTVAVLKNEHVAIGVQCDGMAAVVPLEPMNVTATAQIGGVFNRLGRGSVYAGDDFGGFAINTYPVIGSGTTVDFGAVTSDLWFEGLARNDTNTLAPEGEESQPGWQVRWSLKPGERIFLSGFPCRPFDWEQSFNERYQLTHRENEIAGYDSDWYRANDVMILWDFHQRQWGMGFSDNYLPIDADNTQAHIKAIQEQGLKVMPYNSAWFHRTRDADVWIESARRMIEDEGFQGMYSDGLPAVEWLVGYEEMRMLRELLPDGLIRVHDSLPQSGRHVAEYAPYVYTYASTTYQAEHVETEAGPGWPWVRYVISSYRQSNAIGDIKGDMWRGFGGDEPEQQTKSRLAGLVWNARPGSGAPNYLRDVAPVWDKLEANWREHGDDPFYYDRHYLPLAQELTGFRVGRAAMPIMQVDGDTITLSTKATGGVSMHYTLDGSEPTADSPTVDGPITVGDGQTLKAITLADGLEPSAVAIYPLPTD